MIRRITGNRGIYGVGNRLPALIVIWDAQLKFLPCAKNLRNGEMADQRVVHAFKKSKNLQKVKHRKDTHKSQEAQTNNYAT